jgi:hypothetical protein
MGTCFWRPAKKNVATAKAAPTGAGDIWTWVVMDADTKLVTGYFVGGRDGECAKWFIEDDAQRLSNRVQLTSDGHKAYLEAVEGAFGADIDYAQLVKLYGASSESAKGRYSPADCTGIIKNPIEGKPDPESWLGLFEQFFRFDKWNACRVQAAAICDSRLK